MCKTNQLAYAYVATSSFISNLLSFKTQLLCFKFQQHDVLKSSMHYVEKTDFPCSFGGGPTELKPSYIPVNIG